MRPGEVNMNARTTYFKNVIVPGLILSGVTGVFTGAFIFFFKWGADFFAGLSGDIYGFVRDNLAYLPLMISGLAALAVLTAFFIKKEPVVSGGGIPTAEGILRGLLSDRSLSMLPGAQGEQLSLFEVGDDDLRRCIAL